MKKISLTGIKPTGTPHLGNYLGAIRPAIAMASGGNYEGFYFIADYHSLTTINEAKTLKEFTYEVAATWLACGLDPSKVTIYRQSDVPEVLEFHWILSCFTAKGHMNRAHAYKALIQENIELKRDPDQGINMGIYTYPILMAADILFLQADIVPVGPDQLQHLEIAREIANSFNYLYGNIFKPPLPLEQEVKTIIGLDGRKMSKSYGNTIPIFSNEKQLKKSLYKIKTDSLPPEAPKDPNDSIIMDMYKYFATEEEIKLLSEWFKRGIGWGEAKLELFNVVNRELEGPRALYEELMNDKKKIDDILKSGAEKVRPKAQNFLKEVKSAIGVL